MDWTTIISLSQAIAQILIPLLILVGVRTYRLHLRSQGKVEENEALLQLLDRFVEMAIYQIEAWSRGTEEEVSGDMKLDKAVKLVETLLNDNQGKQPFSRTLIESTIERKLGQSLNEKKLQSSVDSL